MNADVLVRETNYNRHYSDYIIRFKDLKPEQITKLEEYVKKLDGHKSVSCLNLIEYALFHGAGIRMRPESSLRMHPNISSIFTGGLKYINGEPVKTEFYRFENTSVKGLTSRINKLSSLIYPLLPLTGKG